MMTFLWRNAALEEASWLCQCGCRFVACGRPGDHENVVSTGGGPYLPTCPACFGIPGDDQYAVSLRRTVEAMRRRDTVKLSVENRSPEFFDLGYFHAPYLPADLRPRRAVT